MATLKPTIVERDPFIVIGLEYIGPMDNFEGIAALWGGYTKRAKEITPKIGTKIGYGIFYNTPEQAEMGETCYMACAPVTAKTKIPKGMEKLHVPGGTFVMLTHKGILTDLPKAFEKLFKWIDKSPYKTLSTPGYEFYDERFSPSSPECEIDIFIPVTTV
jgi:predicted transcriptional regulator YdeE